MAFSERKKKKKAAKELIANFISNTELVLELKVPRNNACFDDKKNKNN